MREHLQLWYRRWLKEHEDTNLLYSGRKVVDGEMKGSPSLAQVHFVRDHLAGLFWSDIPYESRPTITEGEGLRVTALVIGEHRSKSVRLPVFLLEREDLGLKIVLRYNFYDWNVSVVSEKPLLHLADVVAGYSESEKARFPNGYTKGSYWGYCYFQGFPAEYYFGPYSENNRQFSTYLGSDYSVYTFLWLILREVRGYKDR